MMRLVSFVVFCCPFLLWGQSVESYQLNQMIAESEWIGEGRVFDAKAYLHSDGLIYTRYRVKISKEFKGSTEDSNVSFSSVGGVLGDDALKVCPSLHMEIGQTGIFFLRENSFSADAWIPVSADKSIIYYDEYFLKASDNHGEIGTINQVVKQLEELTGKPAQVKGPLHLEGMNDSPEALAITSISPLTTQAGRGREITITGTDFGGSRGVGIVFFRNANAGSSSFTISAVTYNSWTDTEIKVVVPTRAGSGKIRVQNNVGVLSAPSSQSLNITYNVSNANHEEPRLIDDESDGDNGYRFVYSNSTVGGGVDITAVSGAVESIERAINTWTTGTSFAVYGERECGTSSRQSMTRDNVNLITFDSDAYDIDVRHGSSTLGVMFSYYRRCGSAEWEIRELDMVLRRDGDPNMMGGSVNWEYGPAAPSAGEVDFQSVVLHELGHGLGLGHCRVSGAVMFPSIIVGSTNRNLQSSETTGGGYIHAESKSYAPPTGGGCPAARQYGDHDPNELCSLVLPLDLISFTAQPGSSENHIHWQTVNEIDHSHIILQYDVNGRWTNLSKFNAKGNDRNSINDYKYTHDGLWPAVYSYRLKIVGIDGNYEFSPIASCHLESTTTLWEIDKNRNGLRINGFNASSYTEMMIFDIHGREVWQKRISGEGHVFDQEIVTSNWQSGVYILRVQNDLGRFEIFKWRNIKY